MTDIRAELVEKAEKLGLEISLSQAENFQAYMELLLEWNEKMNLTAITEPSAILEKHFLDSLTLLLIFPPKQGAKLIDVGTGAGFPGIPLKILRPDLDLTLLDSLNKRLSFLKELCAALKIEAVFIHKRAEEAGQEKQMRESYDIAVARAVAPLNVLCEYCLPFVKTGGYFVAMKGPGASRELLEAMNAIAELGGGKPKTEAFTLPNGEARSLLLLPKMRVTPKRYPRHGGTIAKHPLA